MEENQLSVSNERLFAGDFSDRLSSSQLLFSSPERVSSQYDSYEREI